MQKLKQTSDKYFPYVWTAGMIGILIANLLSVKW
jgi:hypothetical protein